MKSFQKILSENTQKRRPRGSSIKHGEIWPAKFGQMCLPQIFQVYLLQLAADLVEGRGGFQPGSV